ncbi:MAG: hypothetical protein AAFY78_01185 [Cyanobacteria bacterium J06648_16]
MTAAPDYMKRFLLWVAISLPPTLMVVFSLAPFDIFAIWLFGGLAAAFLCVLITALSLIPVIGSQKRCRPQATAALLIVVSIILFNWPLRIGYTFSRPAFNRVAEQVMAGDIPETPRRIGWFRIEGIELPEELFYYAEDGIVCLWTDVHPYGNTGFVQTSPNNLPFNLWSHFRLDNTWQFIAED